MTPELLIEADAAHDAPHVRYAADPPEPDSAAGYLSPHKGEGVRARARFARTGKESRGGLVLTERDAALLTDLFTHQLMDRGQIQALYFGSVPRCNARLRQLYDHGFVSRSFSPLSPYGSQGLYRAGRAAADLIAARLDMDVQEVRRLIRTRSEEPPQFVEHTLGMVDFYLALRRGLALQGTQPAGIPVPETPAPAVLDLWLPELLCRHDYETRRPGERGWRAQVFKPDGFARLCLSACGSGGGDAREFRSFFLEIDRGHTSAAGWEQKITYYGRYRNSGLFEETYGAESGRFTTLVVTTGAKRRQHLIDIARRAGETDRFWFTTAVEAGLKAAIEPVPEVAPSLPLTLRPIWHLPGGEIGSGETRSLMEAEQGE